MLEMDILVRLVISQLYSSQSLYVTGVYISIFEETRFFWGIPGGSVVRNPTANAGDAGSSPDPG